MAIDDRLYDLSEAPDHRFPVYSSLNAYITPYSSDTHGGELITEFNQRAAWNTLLKKEIDFSDYAQIVADKVNAQFGTQVEVDVTTGQTANSGPGLNSFKKSSLHNKNNWKVISYATGVRDESDFSLAMVDGNLKISAGVALVYGYFVEASAETTIAGVDCINNTEVAEVKDNPGQTATSPCRTKFIKLAVQYTQGEHARHDERLIPPVNGVYSGAVIVINDELPYGNELLLGTITRDASGRFALTENPYKTRMVPLDTIQGAENYDSLLSAVQDDHIYGIKFGSTDGSEEGKVTNLFDIDPWLWLHEYSNLAELLKSVSTNPDTAGNATDMSTRGLIVSDKTPYTGSFPIVDNFNCLQRVDARSLNQFARITWHQAAKDNGKPETTIDARALYLPYAVTNSPLTDYQVSLKKAPTDESVVKPNYNTDIFTYPNGVSGTDGLMTYQQCAMLQLVFDDYLHRRDDGLARGKAYGPFLSVEDAKNWFQKYKPTVHIGDYFWVINDTAEAGGQKATAGDDDTYTLTNIETNYGTVTGTVTGTAKQSQLSVPITGTGTGTITEDDGTEKTVDMSIEGTGQGTINAQVKGNVTGTLDSFTQNISSRYVCIVATAATSGSWCAAHGVIDTQATKAKSKYAPYQVIEGTNKDISSFEDAELKQNILFAVESVERGFAVPATADVFGVAKVGTGSELFDVIVDASTQRLRVTERLINLIKNGGYEVDDTTEISITPGTDLTKYEYHDFVNGVRFKMSGNASEWRAALDTTGTLSHIRGDVILDFSAVVEDGIRSDGYLLNLIDIDTLTLHGDNHKDNSNSTETLTFNVNHCKVNSPFFTNIGRWEYSSFKSGGDTIELITPWVTVDDVFVKSPSNSVSFRFSSVTMGIDGITNATMDIWVHHEGWSDFNGNIDRVWSSSAYIKFPPLFFEYDTNDEGVVQSTVNMSTLQHIPDNLNMKISGTAGVHTAWDKEETDSIPSGNMLVNLDWEYNGNPADAKTPAGKIYLNLYMKNSSAEYKSQKFANLRFRANVQVIRLDTNEMSDKVDYTELYPEGLITRLN